MTGHSLSRMPMNRPEEAGSFRRIKVITGVAARHCWPEDVRARILAETFEESACVSTVTRRYGAAASQAFGRRRAPLAQAAATQSKTAIVPPSLSRSANLIRGQLSRLVRSRLRSAWQCCVSRRAPNAKRFGRYGRTWPA